MNLVDEMDKARMILVRKQPFFGYLSMRMDFEESDRYPTIWTDGKKIYFNPNYIGKLNLRQRMFEIMHEIGHLTLKHFFRVEKFYTKPEKWQKLILAQDYEVDHFVVDSLASIGVKDPLQTCAGPIVRYNKDWVTLTFEEIFGLLPDDPPPPSCSQQPGHVQEKDGKKDSDSGPCDGAGGGEGPEEAPGATGQELADQWAVAILQAAEYSKQKGHTSAKIEAILDKIRRPSINWKRQIRHFFQMAARDDYSWTRLNRKYLSQGVSLPGLYSERVNLCCALDTSGSVSDKELSRFLSETWGIAKTVGAGFKVILCDAEITGEFDVKQPSDVDRIKVSGRGGTAFEPVFERIRKLAPRPRLLVYFTDLHGSFPKSSPVPTLWVDSDSCSVKPPFGRVIRLPKGWDR